MEIVSQQSRPIRAPKKPFYTHLYFQVVVGFVVGALLGYFFPSITDKQGVVTYHGFAESLHPLADAFIKLIRMLLAPIIFGTVVVGIAQMGNLKEVGRVGIKALFCFEVITTLALVIGLVVVNLFQPGAGFKANPATLDVSSIASYTSAGKGLTATGFLMNIIPTSIADAFVSGNMLQVIFISVLFGLALAHLPDRGKPMIDLLNTMLHALFNIVRYVMYLAPLAVMGAIAFTIGTFGVSVLKQYLMLIGCLYITSLLFIILILWPLARLSGISFLRFLVYIGDEIFITFATTSTEAVFPRMVEKLERMGCSKSVVGLVLPAGYTFNAVGGCIYMTMAAVFLAQATNTHLSLYDQIVILAVCLFTSKGSAGVTGAAFIALAATLSSMDKIPVASLVLLVGVDRFLNEARAVTNVIANGVTTVAVARWEGVLDVGRATAVLNGESVPDDEFAKDAVAAGE